MNIQTVYLYPEIKILEEVIITGECSGVTRNTVSNNLTSFAINRALGTSLTSLLEQVSGVSSISTGTTVAKPVIQGMYGNRILIINNGSRQTGQQWGVDHAPEVDMNGNASIRVIKVLTRYDMVQKLWEELLSWNRLPYPSGRRP